MLLLVIDVVEVGVFVVVLLVVVLKDVTVYVCVTLDVPVLVAD